MRKMTAGLAAFAALAITLAGCSEASQPDAQEKENTNRQSNYERLVNSQPAHTLDYSPTRETKNRWIDTWGHKGKVAYIYLRDGNGHVFGYYVTEGLPVSYCTSLIPPYQIVRDGYTDSFNTVVVPGPSVDGTYASASNCQEVYGFDAVTGAYLEWNIGFGINQQISDQPLPQYGDAKPLGPARISEVKQK